MRNSEEKNSSNSSNSSNFYFKERMGVAIGAPGPFLRVFLKLFFNLVRRIYRYISISSKTSYRIPLTKFKFHACFGLFNRESSDVAEENKRARIEKIINLRGKRRDEKEKNRKLFIRCKGSN